VRSHFYPLVLLDADDVSASAQHESTFSHAKIFDYSFFPAVEDPALAHFTVLQEFGLAPCTLDGEHCNLPRPALFEHNNRTENSWHVV
jgi:hypothetical protein